jgi:protein-S-isoprenylcysteine O-methyltransferase Ste14
MAFDLEEWNKLSEAECERRYKQRLRDEERGKNIAVIVAFVLLVWLLIAVFRASPETTVLEPGGWLVGLLLIAVFVSAFILLLRRRSQH